MANIPLEGVGTRLSGYAGAKYGPFACEYCVWFHAKTSACTHPVVISDPQVPGTRGGAKVDPDGCCNHFRPNGRSKLLNDLRKHGG